MHKIIDEDDLRRLIERNNNEHAALNSALIVSAAIWGVKAGELSLIEVADILDAKGQLKKKWTLRAEISFNGHARDLYIEHESLVKRIDTYLDDRVIRELGTTNIGEYRHLDPDSKLFLNPGGEPFKFARRESGNKVNLQPTGMNAYFKRLIQNAGLVEVTFKDFRRSLAIQMFREGQRKTGVIKDIMMYMGIRSYSAMRKILNHDPVMLHDMIKGVHKRI